MALYYHNNTTSGTTGVQTKSGRTVEFDSMMTQGIFLPSDSQWVSPLHLVPNKDEVPGE